MEIKYLSLFSGIAGFELGIQQAYETKIQSVCNTKNDLPDNNSIELQQKLRQPTCIGFSEIDKYAVQIYKKHFPKHKNYGDIKTINASELPDFNLVVGGFPCQSFSIAGKRGGFKDTRGTLFFDIARIIKVKRPRYLLLENVKGLLSHDEGNTFATIISTLDELGYDLQWQVLNSKNFGVPQNRERVFIIGHLRGTSRPKVFPIAQSSKSHLKYSAGVVSNREKWLKGAKHLSREFSQGQRIYDSKGISQCLAGNAGGQGGKTGLYAVDTRQIRDGARFYKDFVPTLSARDWKGGNNVMKDMKIRRLTPTECERLQGFPDDWTEGISDTQRYKTLGNAVTVNVIKAIIQRLLCQPNHTT